MKIKQKAFTLIELLLVISIIALLSSVIISSTMESRNKAKIANIQQSLIGLRNEAELYRADTNAFNNSPQSGYCPSITNSSWGALGTETSVNIFNSIRKLTGGGSSSIECAVARDGWAVYINGAQLASINMLISQVFAATNTGICYDSEGRSIVFLDSGNSNWAGYGSNVGGAFSSITSNSVITKYSCKE